MNHLFYYLSLLLFSFFILSPSVLSVINADELDNITPTPIGDDNSNNNNNDAADDFFTFTTRTTTTTPTRTTSTTSTKTTTTTPTTTSTKTTTTTPTTTTTKTTTTTPTTTTTKTTTTTPTTTTTKTTTTTPTTTSTKTTTTTPTTTSTKTTTTSTKTTTTTPTTTTSTKTTSTTPTTTTTSTKKTTTTTTSTPNIVGDPAFVGFRGQSYQVHGSDNAIYNLFSSPLVQLNTQFRFLKEGDSRNIKELRNKLIHDKNNKLKSLLTIKQHQHNHNHSIIVPPLTLSFSHPGQYMTSFGIKIKPYSCAINNINNNNINNGNNNNNNINNNPCDDSNITYLEIGSGAYEEGLQLLLNDKLLSFITPQIIHYPSTCNNNNDNNNDNNQCDVIIDYSSPYRIILSFRWLSLIIENSDYFLNIPSISLNENSIKKDIIEIINNNNKINNNKYDIITTINNNNNYLSYIHGLLGCSYSALNDKLPYGQVDDYIEENNNIFGNKFISNRF